MAFDYISDYENFNFTYCIRLFSSCDGLLCIVALSGKIVIWNPSTRQHHQLPPNPNPNMFLLVDLGMTHLLMTTK